MTTNVSAGHEAVSLKQSHLRIKKGDCFGRASLAMTTNVTARYEAVSFQKSTRELLRASFPNIMVSHRLPLTSVYNEKIN